MTTSIEYALMASNAYAVKKTVTHDNNTIPIPSGWMDMEIDGQNDDTGFTARAYKNTTTGEIVIAYTGTTMEGNLVDKAKDWVLANIPAGTGAFLAPQVTDAAKFYLDVLSSVPVGTPIDTIHSTVGTVLTDNVESLILTGTDDLDATGNAQANNIYGTQGANSLAGGAGNFREMAPMQRST